MKVLVIGSGAREHAICWKLKQSPLLTDLFCAPGNTGTQDIAKNVSLKTDNVGALALWAVDKEIDLTIVGPEAPLAEGLVDIFSEHGLRVFGPTREAAQLESSKIFAKEVMKKAGIKTAAYQAFTDFGEARQYLESIGAPVVLKADGLCAGKGVVVAETLEQAMAALEQMMMRRIFGEAGAKVVIEEKIIGREASLMAIVDGHTVLPLVVSQDYKRLNDRDQGPNTGGMGSISPTPALDDARVEQLVGEIFVPVLAELLARGISYTGFLYAGVMIDRSGSIKVLEFNCRLGDPETQVILARLESDLLSTLQSAVRGDLASVDLKWSHRHACCVVAASRGYPGKVDDGKKIEGLFEPSEDLVVYHAGTAPGEHAGEVLTKGGRILTVTALGKNAAQARERAYEGVTKISFEGMHYRKDIGEEG